MPVEDVQFLLNNSEEDEFIMYIDSSQRDKVLYPNPNQYSIVFTEPFKNVCGINVLDCLVPRTMYNIDTYNNTLMVTYLDGVASGGGTQVPITIPPLDYTLDNFALYMGTYLASSQLSIKPVGRDLRSSGKVYLESNVPFQLDLQNSTMAEVIGMDEPVTKSRDGTNYTYMGMWLARSLRQIDNGPVTLTVSNPTAGVVDLAEIADVFQTITLSSDCELENVTVSSNAIVGLTVLDAETNNVVMTLSAKTTPNTFLADNTTYVLFRKNTPYTVRATLATGSSFIDVSVSNSTPWVQPMDDIGSNFITNLTTSTPMYRIFPPGLLCLSGERCILMRCPTIEQHMNTSYIYGGNSPGLALITLGVTGFSTQRADFTSMKYKSFFPIGKLPQVSIRFETTRGSLYDFKGVNHTIVLALRYLSPKRRTEFDNKVLNANYNPDYLSYLIEHHRITEELHEQTVENEEIDEFYEKRYDISDASGEDSEVDIDTL